MTDKPLPPAVTQAMNFAKAVGRHVAHGSLTVSRHLAAARLAVCNRCPSMRSDGRCADCGCPLKTKTTWSREACPKGHWGQAEFPGLKLIRRPTIGKGYHRSGWPFAMSALKPLVAMRGGILFDDFAEQTWFYQGRREPITEPWVGVFHHPPDPPAWAHPWERLDVLAKKPAFVESMKRLRVAIVLADHLADWVRDNWDVPVAVVRHPTATDAKTWSAENWEAEGRRLLQVGWYLRNTRAIHQVDTDWRRVRILQDSKPVVRDYDRACGRHLDRPVFTGTVERTYVPNAEYDHLMASSVVVTEILDAGANNVVVECLARSTPILVNRHPAVVEYLGESYPLYFDRIEDAGKLLTAERIQAAADHLAQAPKDFLTAEHFRARVASVVRTFAGAA